MSHGDYCDISVHLHSLDSVLNNVIVGKRKFDLIMTSIRDEIHWLPVCQRMNKAASRHHPRYNTDCILIVNIVPTRGPMQNSVQYMPKHAYIHMYVHTHTHTHTHTGVRIMSKEDNFYTYHV